MPNSDLDYNETIAHYKKVAQGHTIKNDGSKSLEIYLRAPYEKVEEFIAQRRFQLALDFGCGRGLYLSFLAEYAKQVIAIDLSKESIKRAQSVLEDKKIQNANLIVTDAESYLASSRDNFDLIFCAGSLYYFDLKKISQLIKGRTKIGGFFVAVESNGSNFLMNFYRKVRTLIFSHRDRVSLQKLVQNEGFILMAQTFSRSQLIYFDFLVLLAPLLGFNKKLQKYFVAVAKRIDAIILNKMGLRFLAFKVVLIAQNEEQS